MKRKSAAWTSGRTAGGTAARPGPVGAAGTLDGNPGGTLNALALSTSASLRRLFKVLTALDILGQTLFFAQFLEPAEHLANTFILTGFDTNSHRQYFPC